MRLIVSGAGAVVDDVNDVVVAVGAVAAVVVAAAVVLPNEGNVVVAADVVGNEKVKPPVDGAAAVVLVLVVVCGVVKKVVGAVDNVDDNGAVVCVVEATVFPVFALVPLVVLFVGAFVCGCADVNENCGGRVKSSALAVDAGAGAAVVVVPDVVAKGVDVVAPNDSGGMDVVLLLVPDENGGKEN